ncbi:zinc finger protein 260 isoform X1 [Sergentomyia squamirostris]
MTEAVEFCLANDLTVVIPASSLPVIQHNLDPVNEYLPECSTKSHVPSLNCDKTQNLNVLNIPRKNSKFYSKKIRESSKSVEIQCKSCKEKFHQTWKLHRHCLLNHLPEAGNHEEFNCFFCLANFNDTESWQNHVLVHGNLQNYECPDCCAVFCEFSKFLKHMEDHRSSIEKESFTQITKIHDVPKDEVHSVMKTMKIGDLEWQKRDNKVRPFTCNICERSFTLASTLSLHKKRTHLGIKPHECTDCGWKFAQSSDLIKHMRKHSGERPYKCEICDLAFSQRRNLKNHMKMHTEAPSKCKYCDKIFAIDTSLLAHLKKHEGVEATTCEFCGIPYCLKKDLEQHRRRQHGESREYKCTTCEKIFGKKCDLIKHQRIHSGEKPFVCTVCNKSFTHPTSLRNHKSVHTGEKPFQCSVCGKSFGFAGNLKVHMRSHTGERPYECTVCRKSFSRSANLIEHAKIHTGEKDYKCNECGKAFTNSSTFSKHKKIHTGIRPHSCPSCSKAFIQYAHLAKHLRIHTGEKPYKCDLCGRFFRRSDTLTSHMKIHTKGEVSKNPEIFHITFSSSVDHLVELTPQEVVYPINL